MKSVFKVSFLLYFFGLFLINIVYAKEKNITFAYQRYRKTNSKEISENDKFYMIFVNNTSNDASLSRHEKRQNVDFMIDSLITDIHNLIVENIDTYEDTTVLEEMEEEGKLRKRDTNGESNLVYRISSIESRSVLYAYLSPTVAKNVKDLTNIIACEPNNGMKFFSTGDEHYNRRDIQLETGWEDFLVRSETDLHLSLISQGKYDDRMVYKYDTTFYHPESSGQDIDIFFIDSGFNFGHDEFSDIDGHERIIKCGYNITHGKVYDMESTTNCHVPTIKDDHGTEVADVAAGKKHGVANKANVYGFVLTKQDELDEADLLGGIQYIRDNLFRPGKAVINISLGGYYLMDKYYEIIDYIQELITEMSNEGAVFVAAAGNEAVESFNEKDRYMIYPCAFDDVICVGAIDNVGINNKKSITWNDINKKEMNPDNYVKADYSNYGKAVDIYAPGFAYVEYKTADNKSMGGYEGGTSMSSPIVAGVAATIMSEHPDTTFTSETMLIYLSKLAEKNMISDLTKNDNNLFINNGKHIVYSLNNSYFDGGCGLRSGNKVCDEGCCTDEGFCSGNILYCRTDKGCQIKYGYFVTVISPVLGRCGYGYGACPFGSCCSYDGYCGTSENYCDVGCQIDYGTCKKKYIMDDE